MSLCGLPMWYWSYLTCKNTGIETYMLLDKTDTKMIDAVLPVTTKIILDTEPLYRYKQLLRKSKSTYIIRITADCPLINEYMIMDMYLQSKLDKIKFMYNELDGMDVQIIHKSILDNYKYTSEEHVINMNKIKGDGLYTKYDMHLSVDTQTQLDMIKLVTGDKYHE